MSDLSALKITPLNSCTFNFTPKDFILDKETISKDETDELPLTAGQNDGDSFLGNTEDD